jgi:hypothetical protein
MNQARTQVLRIRRHRSWPHHLDFAKITSPSPGSIRHRKACAC